MVFSSYVQRQMFAFHAEFYKDTTRCYKKALEHDFICLYVILYVGKDFDYNGTGLTTNLFDPFIRIAKFYKGNNLLDTLQKPQ